MYKMAAAAISNTLKQLTPVSAFFADEA